MYVYVLWLPCKGGIDPSPRIGSDVDTDETTHVPRSIKKFIIHIIGLSGKSRADTQADLEGIDWRER